VLGSRIEASEPGGVSSSPARSRFEIAILTMAATVGCTAAPEVVERDDTLDTEIGLGVCDHELCVEGEPLQRTCDPCAEAVCVVDPYCCDTEWDDVCVDDVTIVCGEACEPSAGG
jgi:hypothetical protein